MTMKSFVLPRRVEKTESSTDTYGEFVVQPLDGLEVEDVVDRATEQRLLQGARAAEVHAAFEEASGHQGIRGSEAV